MKPGGIILAGGKSSRMGEGTDKLMEPVGGKPLLLNAINILKAFCDPVIVVGRDASDEIEIPQVDFVKDKISSKGPLGGIYTGLSISEKTNNLVIAADMPFISGKIIHTLFKNQGGAEIVVPRVNGIPQTLCALYSTSCLPIIEDMIDRGLLAVWKLLKKADTRYIDMPDDRSFSDVDTQEDLEKLIRQFENN